MVLESLAVSPKVIVQFLAKTLPFRTLPASSLEQLAKACLVEYFPRETVIFRQDVSDIAYLYLIQKGGVKVYRKNQDAQETLMEMCGAGGAFGAHSLFRGTRSDVSVQAYEDTYCFLLEKTVFFSLVEQHSRFAQFYLENLSEDFTSQAYGELRRDRLKLRDQSFLHLFKSRVRSLVRVEPVMIHTGATILEAGSRMDEFGIGSLLVRNPNGIVEGIITDQDLRTKVVANGMDYGETVDTIMNAPIYTVPADVPCFEALLEFVRKGVDHLVVEQNEEILGVVTARDVMIHQGTWPIYLFREIAAQKKIEGLHDLSRRIPMAIRTMIEEGARASNVSRVITLMADSVLKRLMDLLVQELGSAPVDFCWLSLGVDGRREQTLGLHPENALLYQDPGEKDRRLEAEAYFECLSSEADAHLRACRFQDIQGLVSPSNPCWRKPYPVWENYFEQWISALDPGEAISAINFLDFRPTYGKESLAAALRRGCISRIRRQPMFLAHLAADCLANQPPLSFYGDVVIGTNGKRTHRVDLARQGLSPFIDLARLMALRCGISETNTVARFELLAQEGKISMELCSDAREAYEFVVQLNLVHQLRLFEKGSEVDSYIDAGNLSDLERKILKETFTVINALMDVVRQELSFFIRQ
jgi:CBS domain-containing protein